MKKKKIFQIKINEGDAVIRLKSNKMVELLFGEDEETIIRSVEFSEQEVYKTAVQFALMIDTFLKNGEGLNNIIMHSATGSIAAELTDENIAIKLGFATSPFEPLEVNFEEDFSDISGKVLSERLDEMQVELKDNVIDASTRFNKREDNETD